MQTYEEIIDSYRARVHLGDMDLIFGLAEIGQSRGYSWLEAVTILSAALGLDSEELLVDLWNLEQDYWDSL